MGLDEVVLDESRSISLHKAVETVFKIRLEDDHPFMNHPFQSWCIGGNKSWRPYQENIDFFYGYDGISLHLTYLSNGKDNKLIIEHMQEKATFDSDQISRTKRKERRITEYPIDDFFELNKLAAVYNQMSSVKVRKVKTINIEEYKGINYEIEMIPSQEVLNALIEKCYNIIGLHNFRNLGEAAQNNSLIRKLRKLGVAVPSSADLDIKETITRFFPQQGEIYKEVDIEWFDVRFGGKVYDEGNKEWFNRNSCEITFDLNHPERIHFYIEFWGIKSQKQRYEYAFFLTQQFRKKGIIDEKYFPDYESYDYWKEKIDYEINVTITSQHQLEQLFSAFRHLYQKIEHVNSDNLLDKLLQQNIAEQDAFALFEAINDDFSSVKAAEDTNQKNRVYYVTDKEMRRKVVKIMSVAEEANIEHLILTEFGKHPVVSQYVPKLYSSELIEITVAGIKKYALIEEDVRNHEQQLFEQLISRRNKKQITHYLNYWMTALAKLHHYGTEILKNCLEPAAQKDALRLLKEKDKVRISVSGIVYDKGLQSELLDLDLENRSTVIHQDLRYENRIGKTAIDWGHAGKGNSMLDLVRVFVDPRFEGMKFIEDDYKQYISSYLTERKRIETNTETRYSKKTSKERAEKISQQELKTAYFDFSALRVMYAESQAAYLITANGESRKSSLMTDFLQYKLPGFEKVFK